MTSWRALVKDLTPPLLARVWRRRAPDRIRFSGPYSDWSAASTASLGYAADAIFDRTRDAATKVAQGEAVYERDSVLFDQVEFVYPVIAALLRSACADNGRLRVLDFGGSLGTTYRQFVAFGAPLRELRWSIVEQARHAAWGKTNLESAELRFFEDLEAAVRETQPNVVLLSGVLQYLEDPHSLIDTLMALAPVAVIVDRTFCSSLEVDSLAVQLVPPSIYDASYPCWIFSTAELLRSFQKTHDVRASYLGAAYPFPGSAGEFHEAGFILDPKARKP